MKKLWHLRLYWIKTVGCHVNRGKADKEQFSWTIWSCPSENYEEDAKEGKALAPMHFGLDN
ncbi:hypothetical protein AKJ65_06160 [candidate division MSBL1 archaeon SCGC-AAA259E19]|uniref:Uncharacterized protein n=1 Tax=candidate division MSBL1 archaeon SCGC-AAA259E19 TaxID=1698264 RepID=A0A133UHL1_9EURY|nr:hypothetical protein AKJ65_06160 [candidate division MSBL1 archaeon SCGC-AAA259E19]